MKSTASGVDKVGTIGVSPLVRVGQVVAGKPAEQAGLRLDDAILSIDGKPVQSFGEIPPLVAAAVGRPAVFEVWRDGHVLRIAVTPADDGTGPQVGVGPKMVVKKFALIRAVREAMRLDVGHDQADVRGARPPAHGADLPEDDDGTARHRQGLRRRGARVASVRCSTWSR